MLHGALLAEVGRHGIHDLTGALARAVATASRSVEAPARVAGPARRGEGQRTPRRTLNWIEMRGPTACLLVLRLRCSGPDVPLARAAHDDEVAVAGRDPDRGTAAAGPQHEVAGAPTDRIATIVSRSRDRRSVTVPRDGVVAVAVEAQPGGREGLAHSAA